MNVIVTIVLIVAIAMWVTAVYSKLTRLRERVREAWKLLEPDQSNEAVKNVYNKHVDLYNNALAGFVGALIGGAAGFKPARRF